MRLLQIPLELMSSQVRSRQTLKKKSVVLPTQDWGNKNIIYFLTNSLNIPFIDQPFCLFIKQLSFGYHVLMKLRDNCLNDKES